MSHEVLALWERIEPLLAGVERPSRYLDSEWGAHRPSSAEQRWVLVYPDTYEVGQANQALGILYAKLNSIDWVSAERAFVPWVDMGDALRSGGLPAFSLESCTPVGHFDVVGITLPYELTYTNVLEFLDLAGIPLRSVDRGEGQPLVVGGGPCVFNPEPVADFFDAIVIGEAEQAVVELARTIRSARQEGLDRSATLRALAGVGGVYVPSLYEPALGADGSFIGVRTVGNAPAVVHKRVIADLDSEPSPACPVVPFMDVVHDRATVEILRGCTRGCRFCQAGMIYRPVRERSADEIVSAAMRTLGCTGFDEVSLTSLSSADHSTLEEVLRRLVRRLEGTGVSVSLPSLRTDAFSVNMARLIGSGKKTGLTFAPEAGTQRLRDVINKNVTEADLIETARTAFQAGWRRLKLYFMIGLPTETDEDVAAIGALVGRVLEEVRAVTPGPQRGGIRISVSVSTFVPKAGTPFQWEPQIDMAEAARRQEILRASVPRKGVELAWHDARVSTLEGVIARGGREISHVIEDAWRSGCRFDAWTEQFSLERWLQAASRRDPDLVASSLRRRDPEAVMPWDHISSGVSRAYLLGELREALAGNVTQDCSADGCTGCDACDVLGVSTVTERTRSR